MSEAPVTTYEVYKRPDGELIDVIRPASQDEFPDTAQGQAGQVVVMLPVEGGTVAVIWDDVPDDWVKESEQTFPKASEPSPTAGDSDPDSEPAAYGDGGVDAAPAAFDDDNHAPADDDGAGDAGDSDVAASDDGSGDADE